MNSNTARIYLSIGALLLIALMIIGIFFVQVPADNLRLLDTALGYVAGLVSGAFGFYFGASMVESKKNKSEVPEDEST